jgi:putative Holliday junction resolvase
MGKALGVTPIYIDERYTSVEAEEALIEADISRKKRKEVIDQVAAVLILRSYLDYGNWSET